MLRPLIIAAILFACPALAEPARVVRMSDGDSGKVHARGVEVTVRLLELDTPETGSHAKCDLERRRGEAAKAYAFTILPPGKLVDMWFSGRDDKWRRPLVRVTVDGFDYASHMVSKGLGVPYAGGRKPDWCR